MTGMTGRRPSVVGGALLALGVAIAGCGGGSGGSACTGASATATITSCSPMTVKAGGHITIFGTGLPGMSAVVTFTRNGESENGTVDIGDAESLDVVVPGDIEGSYTVQVCGQSCTVLVTGP